MSFNLYVQDESRFGLFTRNGKSLTAKGVKPICTYQNVFKSTYIFGAFSPYNGDSLIMELPYCNGDNFQIFLNNCTRYIFMKKCLNNSFFEFRLAFK